MLLWPRLPVGPTIRKQLHAWVADIRRIVAFCISQAFPSWQLLLVDLRCHGESAGHPTLSSLPNTVDGAAADVLNLLRQLKLFPEALVGHSFGGKVVMSMADQFGRKAPRLPRPVQVTPFINYVDSMLSATCPHK